MRNSLGVGLANCLREQSRSQAQLCSLHSFHSCHLPEAAAVVIITSLACAWRQVENKKTDDWSKHFSNFNTCKVRRCLLKIFCLLHLILASELYVVKSILKCRLEHLTMTAFVPTLVPPTEDVHHFQSVKNSKPLFWGPGSDISTILFSQSLLYSFILVIMSILLLVPTAHLD